MTLISGSARERGTMSTVLERNASGIFTVPIETRFLSGRCVFVEGEITQGKAVEFAKQMLYLNREAPGKTISVFINSPGGEVGAGLVMYDILRGSRSPVRMFCLGQAYSMAAVLFSAGTEGRYMLPHAKLLLHEPLVSGGIGGSTSSIRTLSDSLLEIRETMNRILQEHTGRSEEEIEKAVSYDHFFDAEESVAFGLCDRVADFGEMLSLSGT